MSEIIDQGNDVLVKEISKEFFRNVYGYMFGALAITGVLAYYCGTQNFYFTYLSTPQGEPTALFWLTMLVPFGLALLIQLAYNKLSYSFLLFLFVLYSGLMGVSLSVLFIAYSLPTLASTFFITSGAFAAMAILGYTTKTDLTKMGSLLYMAFFGIVIASIVNIFMKSDMMDFVISVIGVFVFTGLTAYYMQNFKKMSQDINIAVMTRKKLSLVGGLILYITFINLFISLLRLTGGRD